tara:strand:- start:69 stop:512 length:444 start_codon:yes stop_codon:yes gene_type:complete
MIVKGTRKWIAMSGDMSQLIRLTVDLGKVESVTIGDKDQPHPENLINKMWVLVKKALARDGYEIVPDGFKASHIVVKKITPTLPEDGDEAWEVSVKAKHPMGEELSVSAQGPTREKALRYFWSNWKDEANFTGFHTHLDFNRKYKNC